MKMRNNMHYGGNDEDGLIFVQYVSIGEQSVPVTANKLNNTDEEIQKALSSEKFQEWTKSIDEKLIIKSIQLQGIDMFGSKGWLYKDSC